jgi:hypothetical protein
VLQVVGFLISASSSLLERKDEQMTRADILSDLVVSLLIKSPGMAFTILYLCGVK